MPELLAHLWGDYVLQTERMALRKTVSWKWAVYHATAYTLPFLFLTQNVYSLAVIWGTHVVIDRLAVARKLVVWRNAWDIRSTGEVLNATTGFSEKIPVWLSFWLIVIVDNTLHLTINHWAIRMLPLLLGRFSA
ncbi:MAG: DUF3307 domain-containing protein [Methylacidiphilales bacterium]|nr:DUF3307 domain-containing protein [Candidatus Methylacidiphilales bacterium]MDW8350094.1 DUF3307 domain-containing protein [Verrucomicrobiae bacterium]